MIKAAEADALMPNKIKIHVLEFWTEKSSYFTNFNYKSFNNDMSCLTTFIQFCIGKADDNDIM